jgi:hypothetical protein
MKVSQIGRYYAAAELTKISATSAGLTLQAPFETSGFTLRIAKPATGNPVVRVATGESQALDEVRSTADLDSGKWLNEKGSHVLCFDLPKGTTTITWTV